MSPFHSILFFLVHRKRLKREEQQLMADREKKRQAVALLESQVHRAEMQLSEKRHQLQQRESFEQRKEEARAEIERQERRQKVRLVLVLPAGGKTVTDLGYRIWTSK
jgi:membrane glycosyltransferase